MSILHAMSTVCQSLMCVVSPVQFTVPENNLFPRTFPIPRDDSTPTNFLSPHVSGPISSQLMNPPLRPRPSRSFNEPTRSPS